MTHYSPRLISSSACSSAASLSSTCQLGTGRTAGKRSLAETLQRLSRGLWNRRPHLPRLALEELSDARLRDLGFIDGRAMMRRDPLRD